jgi:hypothetical protein
MTTLKLSECEIPDAEKIVQAKFRFFPWAWYDAVVTPPDEIDPVDFAITIAMNSRATASRMKAFMDRKAALDRLLREVPRDMDLTPATPDKVFDAVRAIFTEACEANGTKLAVSSKVLHRKRPRLVPMLDSIVVDRHYWITLSRLARSPAQERPSWLAPTWPKNHAWLDPTGYMRIMAEEIDHNASALDEIRRRVPADILPKQASNVRILEAALYGYLQEM